MRRKLPLSTAMHHKFDIQDSVNNDKRS